MNLTLDRRLFIASLGGAAAVSLMSDEAKADAIEDAMSEALDDAMADDVAKKFPTMAEVEAQIETRPNRRRQSPNQSRPLFQKALHKVVQRLTVAANHLQQPVQSLGIKFSSFLGHDNLRLGGNGKHGSYRLEEVESSALRRVLQLQHDSRRNVPQSIPT